MAAPTDVAPATESPAPEPQALETKTTAGNYFVANYPPFSFWKRERTDEAHEALSQPPQPDTPLGLYVHLPFCRKRCHFCYFRVYTGRDAKPDRVSRYVDSVLRELSLYTQQRLIAGRRPRYVYFGGGTPSFLSPAQLEGLFSGMQKLLPWDDVEEVTFECEPGTLNPEKLETLHRLGVTRLSLGIENFDDGVLRSNGRAHLSREIYHAYETARSIGFKQINIDLIAGMLNETEENWRDSVRRAIGLGPDCVTVYQMEIPFNTTIYHQMRERGEIAAPVADWPTKRRWTAYAFEELERAGYAVTSAYTAVKDPEAFRFLYRDYLWKGADMVSLGVASFGHFLGTHYQNEKDFGSYVERVARGELPIARAMTMTGEERMVRELILQLKLGGVDAGYFRRKFGEDILALLRTAQKTIGRGRRPDRGGAGAGEPAGVVADRRAAARVLSAPAPGGEVHVKGVEATSLGADLFFGIRQMTFEVSWDDGRVWNPRTKAFMCWDANWFDDWAVTEPNPRVVSGSFNPDRGCIPQPGASEAPPPVSERDQSTAKPLHKGETMSRTDTRNMRNTLSAQKRCGTASRFTRVPEPGPRVRFATLGCGIEPLRGCSYRHSGRGRRNYILAAFLPGSTY